MFGINEAKLNELVSKEEDKEFLLKQESEIGFMKLAPKEKICAKQSKAHKMFYKHFFELKLTTFHHNQMQNQPQNA